MYKRQVEEATVFDAIDSLMADKYMTEDRIMLTGHKRDVYKRQVHSGIDNISLIVKKNYHSLMDHLGSGQELSLIHI